MTSGAADDRVRTSARRLTGADAGELLTLQLAAWVIEAHANETLAIPALHETVEDVAAQLADPRWRIWGLVEHGRLLATVRSRACGERVGIWSLRNPVLACRCCLVRIRRRMGCCAETRRL